MCAATLVEKAVKGEGSSAWWEAGRAMGIYRVSFFTETPLKVSDYIENPIKKF